MAGLGRKTFTRERLTAADINGYLMDQTVMQFASASARDSAIPSASRSVGMRAVTLDNLVECVWTGAAWIPVSRRRTRGYVSGGVTDSGGLFVVGHGLGITPGTVLLTPGGQASDLLDRVIALKHKNSDINGFVVLATRTDDSTVLATNPISFSWSAEF